MKKIILNIQNRYDEFLKVKAICMFMGFHPKEWISSIDGKRMNSLMIESDLTHAVELMEKIATRYKEDNLIVVESTGYCYVKFIKQDIKVQGRFQRIFESDLETTRVWSLDPQTNVYYKVG